MNVPFKNITKVDTSKGVPVWVINMHDFRSFAETHGAPDKTGAMRNLTELNELIDLIKKNFINGRDIGSTAILLSIACINFLSLFSPNATCSAFLKYVAFSKFGGVAYTGNSAKIVTVTRDDQVPAMLPFVLRDNDPIVAGYGVYLAQYNLGTGASSPNDEKIFNLLMGIDISKMSAADADKVAGAKMTTHLFGKHNTLYHDYAIDANTKVNTPALYTLFSMRKGAVLDLVDMKLPNIEICPHPILTIATHNNTLHSFAEIGFSLSFNVRATNSFGLAVTVATTGVQRKRGSGTLLCENTGPVPKTAKTGMTTIATRPSTTIGTQSPNIFDKIIQEASNINITLNIENPSTDDPLLTKMFEEERKRKTQGVQMTAEQLKVAFPNFVRTFNARLQKYAKTEEAAVKDNVLLKTDIETVNDIALRSDDKIMEDAENLMLLLLDLKDKVPKKYLEVDAKATKTKKKV